MSQIATKQPWRPGRMSGWITIVLAVTTAATVGYWAVRGVGERDTEAMESPLILSVARQLDEGPAGLYGPYDGANPLVLIHAPLYYRVSALLAWPIARGGVPSVVAARVAGRAISALSLLATMAAAYRLGRRAGMPPRAGWWSALFVSGSAVLGAQPYAVRPDMMGVALQTWGIVLALGPVASRRRAAGASVLFGLSACVKQHLIAAWAVSILVAARDVALGRRRFDGLAWLTLPGLIVAGLVYGVEWRVTGGRVWDAAFVAASQVGVVHPGDWDKVFIVIIGVVTRSAGIIAAITAAALVAAGSRPGPSRWIAAAAATVVIGLLLAAASVTIVLGGAVAGASTFAAACLTIAVGLAAAAMAPRSSTTGTGVDAMLGLYVVAELGLVVLLTRNTAGAWLNYGIPAVVVAAVMAGRALSRLVDAAPPWMLLVPSALATAVIVVTCFVGLREVHRADDIERAKVEAIFAYGKRPRSAYFFTHRPGWNRVDGRLELVYDDWLYPVFEKIGQAEPRSQWLARVLAVGPVRAIVKTSEKPVLDGTTINLRRLGFRSDAYVEPFYIWIR